VKIGSEPAHKGGFTMTQRAIVLSALTALVLSAAIQPACAQKKYDPGASDTEIKVGNIMPYSGPLSAYALIGRTEAPPISG
jgi:branched-chain amino acid transport system substrate-binding protein